MKKIVRLRAHMFAPVCWKRLGSKVKWSEFNWNV